MNTRLFARCVDFTDSPAFAEFGESEVHITTATRRDLVVGMDGPRMLDAAGLQRTVYVGDRETMRAPSLQK